MSKELAEKYGFRLDEKVLHICAQCGDIEVLILKDVKNITPHTRVPNMVAVVWNVDVTDPKDGGTGTASIGEIFALRHIMKLFDIDLGKLEGKFKDRLKELQSIINNKEVFSFNEIDACLQDFERLWRQMCVHEPGLEVKKD